MRNALMLQTAALATMVAIALLVVPAGWAVQPNPGTIKVHQQGQDESNDNEPKVCSPFYVTGFNMEASSGTVSFAIQGGPDNGDPVGSPDPWTGVLEAEGGGYHFENGPYSLAPGHYKVTVTNGEGEKTKVFKEECPSPTQTTVIPVFPSLEALVLGTLGAAGAAFVIARRRA